LTPGSSAQSATGGKHTRVSPPPLHPVDPQQPTPDWDTKRHLASLFPGATVRCSPNGMVVITPSAVRGRSPGDYRSSPPSDRARENTSSGNSSDRGRSRRSRSRSKSPLSPTVEAWVADGRVLPKAESLLKLMQSLATRTASSRGNASSNAAAPEESAAAAENKAVFSEAAGSTSAAAGAAAVAASAHPRSRARTFQRSFGGSASGGAALPVPPRRLWDPAPLAPLSVAVPSAADAIFAEANTPVVSPIASSDVGSKQLSWAAEVDYRTVKVPPPGDSSDDDDDGDGDDGEDSDDEGSNAGAADPDGPGGPWVNHLTPSLMAPLGFTDAGRGTPLQPDKAADHFTSELARRVVASRGRSLISQLVNDDAATHASPAHCATRQSRSSRRRRQPSSPQTSRPRPSRPLRSQGASPPAPDLRAWAAALREYPSKGVEAAAALVRAATAAAAAAALASGCAPGGAPAFSAVVAAACGGVEAARGPLGAEASRNDAARNRAASPPGGVFACQERPNYAGFFCSGRFFARRLPVVFVLI